MGCRRQYSDACQHLIEHSVAAQCKVAPELLAYERYAGDVYLLETEYLPESGGWMRLDRAAESIQDWPGATAKLDAAADALHACCGSKAVHGDLRAPNIMVRWAAAVEGSRSSQGTCMSEEEGLSGRQVAAGEPLVPYRPTSSPQSTLTREAGAMCCTNIDIEAPSTLSESSRKAAAARSAEKPQVCALPRMLHR